MPWKDIAHPSGSNTFAGSGISQWCCVPIRKNPWIWNQEIEVELALLPITPSDLLGYSVDSCLHNSGLCKIRSPFSQRGQAVTRGHSKGLTEVQATASPWALWDSHVQGLANKKRNHHLVKSNWPWTPWGGSLLIPSGDKEECVGLGDPVGAPPGTLCPHEWRHARSLGGGACISYGARFFGKTTKIKINLGGSWGWREFRMEQGGGR